MLPEASWDIGDNGFMLKWPMQQDNLDFMLTADRLAVGHKPLPAAPQHSSSHCIDRPARLVSRRQSWSRQSPAEAGRSPAGRWQDGAPRGNAMR